MDSLDELLNIAHLRNHCDLDLLLFFARHPDALMTSEQLALLVGYDLQQIAKSLDLLVQHKLLRRTQNPTHAARLYRFRADHWDPPLPEILKNTSTVEGRRKIRQLMNERQRSKKTRPRNRPSSVARMNISLVKEKAHG